MNKWSTDKIVGTGLVIALNISILAGAFCGSSVELQTTLASGLIGFIGRVGVEKFVNHEEEKRNDAWN